MLFAFDFLSALRSPGRPDAASTLGHVSARIATIAAESDARLRERTNALRRHFDLSEALALVSESVRRSHGLSVHEGQLRAGFALAEGTLVEMATGEGKTLAALLPAFCFALRGRGTHVATANSYLAARDADFARPILARLGLTVGLLRDSNTSVVGKQAAYACDVTYGIGAEFGFDYLRDRLALRAAGHTKRRFHELLLRRTLPKPELRQRDLAFAVIDDADSVLLDEARSPLAITVGERRPSATPEAYRLAEEIAGDLKLDQHFKREGRAARLALTPDGERLAFARLTDAAQAQLRRPWPQYLEHALEVRHRLQRDVHYLVVEDRVIVVDEFTKRSCPDRTWQDGLHQAAEARAGVTITEENSAEAMISRPAYFRLYERACGLTGTAAEATDEVRETYQLPVVVVPPDRPCQRVLLPDRVFATRAAKLGAVAREVATRHATGQPILIGVRSVQDSAALVQMLGTIGLPVRVLDATQDAREAAIIERAGQPGMITIATHLAGRGAYIPVPEESVKAGGLHVIGVERHESARLDRQLISRAGHQGQPGSAQFFLSLEDDLIARHNPALTHRLAMKKSAEELHPRHAIHFRRAQRKAEALDLVQRRALTNRHRSSRTTFRRMLHAGAVMFV